MNNEREYQKRVVIATCLSYVIVLLDTSIVNVALEPVAMSLHSDISGLQWVVNAYTLTFASLLLSGGALGDRIGAKTVYLAGLVIFACASALCGLAPNLPVLVAARIGQGVGAALLVPCSLTLINRAFPVARQRASAIGIWAGCGGSAMAAGPASTRATPAAWASSRAMVATSVGGRPSAHPALPGAEHAISSNEAFHLDAVPKRVLIAGAGYIANEFAGIFHQFGAHVILMNRSKEILRGYDLQIRDRLAAFVAGQNGVAPEAMLVLEDSE